MHFYGCILWFNARFLLKFLLDVKIAVTIFSDKCWKTYRGVNFPLVSFRSNVSYRLISDSTKSVKNIPSTPTANMNPKEGFDNLLGYFDTDREIAGEKYEQFRRALIRYFEGRKIMFAEDCADEVFDRASRKISEGVQIIKIYSYCYEIARLILLEKLKSPERKAAPLDDILPQHTDNSNNGDGEEKEINHICLDQCLSDLPSDNKAMIIEYYTDDKGDKILRRKAMASRLGLKREALANRAQRLRAKLESCITNCLKSSSNTFRRFHH